LIKKPESESSLDLTPGMYLFPLKHAGLPPELRQKITDVFSELAAFYAQDAEGFFQKTGIVPGSLFNAEWLKSGSSSGRWMYPEQGFKYQVEPEICLQIFPQFELCSITKKHGIGPPQQVWARCIHENGDIVLGNEYLHHIGQAVDYDLSAGKKPQ
jgi:hypothetical protein